jgi:putative membrane protein
MYGSWDAGTWVWMTVVMSLFAGAFIIGILAVVRASDRDRDPDRDRPRPRRSAEALDVLDQRFARGEIDADEYAERRRILTERNEPTRV